ncbi:hypothetical protein [Pseudomonas sp. CCI2.4]|uniref:hypothetical protein n=1 Tax=Pseudomonas sp. CCI2.4 TaxID=3048617 RepID=UPI002B238AAC|nr:hypothetical protein [Pseudomonas sp. CCI2.4]MEB0133399.1 hypothetical protein [Pseudomonas sp. CCI2.4]
MSRQVSQLFPAKGAGDNEGNGSHNGGRPPGGDEMEARIVALEKSIPDIREALVRIEATLSSFDKHVFPHLATKADLISETGGTSLAVANFRTEITRVEGSMIKWFIGTALVLSGGVGAICFGLAKSLS